MKLNLPTRVSALLLAFLPAVLVAQTMHVGDCVVRVSPGAQITTGGVILDGTAALNNQGTVILRGNWTNNANGITPGGGGTVTLSGTVNQAVSGIPTTFHNLIVNNTSGVSLASDTLAVTGVLTLQNGTINGNTTNSTVDIVPGGSVVRVFGWVFGNLRKRVPTGNPTVVFELGNATLYTPATLSFSGVTTAGRFSARPMPGLQPDLGASCLNFTRRVNQYWRIRNIDVAPANYNATFRYGSSMFFGSPVASQLVPGQWTGSDWEYPTVSGTPTVTLLTATGISGDGDFTLTHGCEPPANDERPGAFTLSVQAFGLCSPTVGFVANSTVSPESNSTAITGEDVWYRFTANSPGARIVVSSAEFDALVELQDAAGNTLDVENVVAGTGNEMMNYYSPTQPLVSGQTYFIAVRNYNSAIGSGTFGICVQRINRTACNQGPGPYTLCQTFKCTSVGAISYSFIYTNQTTSQVHTVNTSAGVTISPLSGLLPGYNYTVSLQAHFALEDGAGNLDVFTIDNPNACTITMGPHSNIVLRDIDRCAYGPKPSNAQIAANTWLCGASFYQWEFTETAPSAGVPQFANGAPANRFLSLPIANVVQGYTYSVRVRPIFQFVIPGNFGTAHCLQIAGAAMAPYEGDETSEMSGDESFGALVYPNPSDGAQLNVRVQAEDDGLIRMRILDASGRLIHADQWMFSNNESLKQVRFNDAIASGLYTIELISGENRNTLKWVVEK